MRLTPHGRAVPPGTASAKGKGEGRVGSRVRRCWGRGARRPQRQPLGAAGRAPSMATRAGSLVEEERRRRCGGVAVPEPRGDQRWRRPGGDWDERDGEVLDLYREEGRRTMGNPRQGVGWSQIRFDCIATVYAAGTWETNFYVWARSGPCGSYHEVNGRLWYALCMERERKSLYRNRCEFTADTGASETDRARLAMARRPCAQLVLRPAVGWLTTGRVGFSMDVDLDASCT